MSKPPPINRDGVRRTDEFEQQDDMQTKKHPLEMELPSEEEEELQYGQEHYILNREKLVQARREKEAEAKFGDYSARLVKRPQKNFLWGYGTKLHDENTRKEGHFRHGELPTIKELINFLEIYQIKDMKVINLRSLGRNMETYAIVGSGFSMRHLYSTAKTLVQEVKKVECPHIVNIPKIAGTKDDSWLMVCVKEVQVHMILDEYREELDLEFRWLNPPPPEMRKKWKTYFDLKKKGD
mmetsp:Transcript_35277/g.54019  ORF Transcript_35277/g.54019 Transcript_35277/m.54019 type:complete len:238 (+) Transcript_35277:266-979(+)|eukprot:CAMPEP_0170483890 /NCGR_PEP_ID=MMETSP0208-20121228/3484_1 /TAXON_ID=197538 /ORGANISM="Strombidium inclinatum, Strain S3" /LENGTH=237 /DNA_ID=CAMNT_0010757085 /DNA_START=247 /DNA_END=960 /DNA_ORIENTATION=-